MRWRREWAGKAAGLAAAALVVLASVLLAPSGGAPPGPPASSSSSTPLKITAEFIVSNTTLTMTLVSPAGPTVTQTVGGAGASP